MSPEQQDQLRGELEEQRNAVLTELEELGADPRDGRIERPEGIDDNFADLGAATAERSEHLALVANARERLAAVETALARMDEGTYGICEVCGEEIPAARLEARPLAVRCVNCAG